MIKAKAPMRIDLAGGWSDIKPFTDFNTGCVINMAINHYVSGFKETNNELIQNIVSGPSGQYKLSNKGLQINYSCDLPTGTGLGSSAAMNVLLAKLINPELSKKECAEKAIELAKVWGIKGGIQDEYASALGGCNYIKIEKDNIEIEPLNADWLQDYMVLGYLNTTREGSNIHGRVWDKVINGKKGTIDILKGFARAAKYMKRHIIDKNLELICDYMMNNFYWQSLLDEEITNSVINSIINRAMCNGAMGVKICGAGGGGCLLFLTEDKERLSKVLSEYIPIIDFEIDHDGVNLIN